MSVPLFFDKTWLAIKKNKVLYYTINFLRYLTPTVFYRRRLKYKLSTICKYDKKDILERVNYYNKLEKHTPIGTSSVPLKVMEKAKSPKAYYFDTFEFTRYFTKHFKINFLFGDITYVSEHPSIQKSRPINQHNSNAVLLKLDKKRHFLFLKDHKKFLDKKDMMIGRAAINQQHRVKFMEMYFGHPLCDLGQINKSGSNLDWVKPKISIPEHLEYKFILSLEGHDVATNLKWIMSSNSIAVMPKPKYETWFMEGRLIPNYHYLLINDDYSDLEERLMYFIAHPDEAQAIIDNANHYVKQFQNKEKEGLISLLVLQKYFDCTSQEEDISI